MITEDIQLALALIPFELWNTCYMVFCSSVIAIAVGLPLGALLTITESGHLKENRFLYHLAGSIVNVGRSIPFVILMIALIPVTRWLAGTSLGTTAAIVPLYCCDPFFC